MKKPMDTTALLAGLDGDLDSDSTEIGINNPGIDSRPLTLPAEQIMSGRRLSEPKQKRTIVLELDPARCKRWGYYDRFEEWFSYENCKDLIDDIRTGEQEVPGIVRKLENDPDGFEFEVVYGGRRHFAAQYICETFKEFKPFRAISKELTDKEAARLMDKENRKRADISDFERCVSYRHLIGKTPGYEPIFATLNELRAAIEAGSESSTDKEEDGSVGNIGRTLTKASLSYMITAGELNEVEELIVLFKGRRTLIPWSLAYKVMHQWNMEGTGNREKILAKAEELALKAHEKSPEDLLKSLLSAVTNSVPVKKQEKPFYNEELKVGGKVAVKAVATNKNLALTIPINVLKEVNETELIAFVKEVLSKVTTK